MSLLPNCAWCGQTLRRTGRVLVSYDDLPGKPEIGWHMKCAERDPLFTLHRENLDDNDGKKTLNTIYRRSPGGRVVSGGIRPRGRGRGLRGELMEDEP